MRSSMYWSGHGGGGGGQAASGIGPIEEIGPGGKYAGRVVGLVPALKFLGDVAGPAAALGLIARRKKVKEYNDQEGERIVGTDPDGHVIKER